LTFLSLFLGAPAINRGPHENSGVFFVGRGATAINAKLLAKGQNEQQQRARDEERWCFAPKGGIL